MSLYLSPALVVSGAELYDAHKPIFGWHNLVTMTTVSADSELATKPATNLANPSTSEVWVSNSTSTQYVTVINLSGETDYVGISRHNLAGMTISVEAVTPASSPSFVEVFSGLVPSDNRPLVLKFARDDHQSIRLKIVPAGTAPQIAVMFVGLLLVMPNGIQPGFTPPSKGLENDRAANWSESGEFLGAIITGSRLMSDPQFSDIDPTLYDLDVAPFVLAANNGQPFFFVWSPIDHPDDTAFCWLKSSAIPNINRQTGQHNLSLSLGGTRL